MKCMDVAIEGSSSTARIFRAAPYASAAVKQMLRRVDFSDSCRRQPAEVESFETRV